MDRKHEAINNLKFIRKTIESSGTYTNIPALAYITAGLFGGLGSYVSYGYVRAANFLDPAGLSKTDILHLGIIWSGILSLSIVATIVFSVINARKYRIELWNGLASRLFLSQVPSALAASVLTVALAVSGGYNLIPALWLLCYGIITYSFSYFTGKEHKIQSVLFLVLGIWAAFDDFNVSLVLLGLGFGGINMAFGMVRLLKRVEGYGTEKA
jgi:hypothetical protein